MRIQVVTFGYLHGAAPEASITVDLRGRLYNPFKDPASRELTGLDKVIYDRVLSTDGAMCLTSGLEQVVRVLALSDKDVTLAVGCAGGRHRSVTIGRKVVEYLDDYEVTLVHRDVDKPVYKH